MNTVVDYAVIAGLMIGFTAVYFGIAFVLVTAYDDSRQDITNEIAEWNKRERENNEVAGNRKDIEWLG